MRKVPLPLMVRVKSGVSKYAETGLSEVTEGVILA